MSKSMLESQKKILAQRKIMLQLEDRGSVRKSDVSQRLHGRDGGRDARGGRGGQRPS